MASRSLSTFDDVVQAIKDIDNQLSKLRTSLVDLHQRRVVNAAASVDLNDYVIKLELNDSIKSLQQNISDSGTFKITNPLITKDILPESNNIYNIGNATKTYGVAHIGLVIAGSILGNPGSYLGNGPITITSNNAGQTSLRIQDAFNANSVNTAEFSTFGGTVFWKVIVGQDSGAPGTMVTRDHVPFTDNTYAQGNTTHRWGVAYLNTVITNTLMNLTGAAVTAPSGNAGVTFSGSVTALVVSGGIITGHTP